MKRLLLGIFSLLYLPIFASWEDETFGWPEQKAPQEVIICDLPMALPERMLLESLSGLAAQGVNESRFQEMVWMRGDNPVYESLYRRTRNTLGICREKRMELWELLEYLKDNGVVKGYVLYRADKSSGRDYSERSGMDLSSNCATVYASLLGGALIDESLQPKAQKLGLRLLKDCREITPDQCFEDNRSLLSNVSALCVDPRVGNCRDFAIAHKMMVYYGTGELTDRVLEWVRPLSPIIGWNCGGEDRHTGQVSRWGHFNTASNWCVNLPFLSAARGKVVLARSHEKPVATINFGDSSVFHSFVMSDGDNMQWSMGRFTDSKSFYGNPRRGLISWTSCPVNLSQVSPYTWNDIADMQEGSSLIEYGGGYHYPDLFAVNRPNREALLVQFARRLNRHMKKLGVTVLGFICMDVHSDAAREAFQVYAREIENLTGILAVQYYPYELGGEILWVDNGRGQDIPVVTARYSIWNSNSYARPRAGAPEYVAALINRDALRTPVDDDGKLAWTVVHAWSEFSPSDSQMPETVSGAETALCSSDRLIPSVRNVSIYELLWRIRMKFRPEQTRLLLREMNDVEQ